jgi:RES domain-containing protein
MAKGDIYARLDALRPASWDGPAFRHTAIGYARGVVNGDAARRQGGRWNPPDSFRTVYASADRETVTAEFRRSIGPGRDWRALAATHVLWQLKVKVDNLVDLRPVGHQRYLGLPQPFDERVPVETCQQIGAAAYYVRYKGLLVPSAPRPGATNVVLFPDLFEDGDICELVPEDPRHLVSEYLPPPT